MMSGMSGYDVFKIIKSNPDTKNIPIMFCTSEESDVKEEEGLKMGAVDYIHKPFNSSLIAIRIKNHLELHLYRMTLVSQVVKLTAP
jgi:DNA-binding response OmpR family regulator